jgi:hypothetical protein
MDHVGPSSPQSVSKLNKEKTTILEEQPAPVVAQSSNIKNIQPDFPMKSKTQISTKRRKKQRSGNDDGKVADTVPKVIVEVSHEQAGEITESIPEGVLEIP